MCLPVVLKAGSLRSWCQHAQVLVRSFIWVAESWLLMSLHNVKGRSYLSVLFSQWSWTHSCGFYSPELIPPANTITLAVRFEHRIWRRREHKHSVRCVGNWPSSSNRGNQQFVLNVAVIVYNLKLYLGFKESSKNLSFKFYQWFVNFLPLIDNLSYKENVPSWP